uniref:Uncharacterized protein n=1 Tax=Trypanosoma vivax (strain Y486) TaxID=1055687 RepID=G0U1K7_TRYVY|nr:hypothetical protein TVY486_0805710 [Trypanosoma vivax Y486]
MLFLDVCVSIVMWPLSFLFMSAFPPPRIFTLSVAIQKTTTAATEQGQKRGRSGRKEEKKKKKKKESDKINKLIKMRLMGISGGDVGCGLSFSNAEGKRTGPLRWYIEGWLGRGRVVAWCSRQPKTFGEQSGSGEERNGYELSGTTPVLLRGQGDAWVCR